jgi:predicted Zn-dependent peptidase
MLYAVAAILFAAPKEIPPSGTAPKPFRLPPTDDLVLPNGMKVTIVPYGIVPKVAVRAYVNAGGVYEPASQVWISKLNALLMKEGTATRSAGQVARDAADMGGQLDVGAGAEFTTAGGVVLSEFGPRFVALLADVLQHPALPSSELARLKADLGRDLAVEKARPDALARELFFQTLFPNHPYGRTYPQENALKDYTVEQVQAFFKGNFAASRTHLYVAGKLDPGLKKSITAAFADWERGKAAVDVPATPVRSRSLQTIDRPGAEQSTLIMGLPVADPTSPDYVVLDVMDSLLGGSFASRITSNIREQKGYTYSPFSQIGTRKHLAFWLESADVTTAVTGPSLKEIFFEIDRIRKEPPSAQEVKGIQNYLAGLFILKNTVSPDAVIAQLHFVDSQGLDRSFLLSYVQKVMAVTPQEIQRVAESYIVPSKMTIVVVGDKAKITEQLKPYETAPATKTAP